MEGVQSWLRIKKPSKLLTGLQVRYVVVGNANREQTQPTPANRMPPIRSSSTREPPRVPSEGIFLSIYKTKVCLPVSISRGRL